MPDVSETRLPGVGVRHEFTTSSGERVGVLAHRSGRREIVVYDRADPDESTAVLHLSREDTRTLGELLGASQVSEALTAVQQLEGLAMDWITVPDGSPFSNESIAAGEFRTRTGVSIVAVIRDGTTAPAPDPSYRFENGDIVVAIGTPDGLAQIRQLFLT